MVKRYNPVLTLHTTFFNPFYRTTLIENDKLNISDLLVKNGMRPLK